MKTILKKNKRGVSLTRSIIKQPSKTAPENQISKETLFNNPNNNNNSEPQTVEHTSDEPKVSPQIVRITFDSINLYLENIKSFYLNEAAKLNQSVTKIENQIIYYNMNK